MKVFFFSSRSYDMPLLSEMNSGKHELFFTVKRLTLETANLATGCSAVSLFTADDASAPVLTHLHALGVRYIALRSVGHDHVDLKKAEQLGIKVANVPEYSPHSVAEHAVAMLLAANRKLVKAQKLMDKQDFRIDGLKGFDLHGKTIGIIGTGKIGMAFARIMNGFGSRLIAHDPFENADAIRLGIKYVSLEELVEESDVISIHCPLTPETKHLISDSQLNRMKRKTILINTSRGPVIDTDALIRALEGDKLQAACLDVYEFEKGLFFEDHRNDHIDERFLKLRSFENVLITAHQGFLTEDALQEISRVTLSNLDSWQDRVPCANELIKAESLKQKA